MPRAHPGVIHPASHRPGHYAVSPPSTSMTVPVTYDARSDIKNTATCATSSAVPTRPKHVRRATVTCQSAGSIPSGPPARSRGVSMGPGDTQFTRICWGPSSRAADRDQCTKPAFADEYAVKSPYPCRPAADAVTTIDPRFDSRSAGSAARVNNPAATIFNAIVCSHTAAGVSSIEAEGPPPAGKNNASNPPRLSSVAAIAASQSSASVISATTSAELAISIDIVDAPLLISSSMLAKPMPEAPPTTATFNPDTPGRLV